MLATGTRDSGTRRRRRLVIEDGGEYHKGEWMESGEDPKLSPLVFLVEQAPHSVLPSHFHRQNEFQLIVDGEGTFGSHAVRKYALHYAGAYTGYGPIVAGPRGLSYFTIRAVYETGGLMLPRSRAELVRGPKRSFYADAFDASAYEVLRDLGNVREIQLVDGQPDLLAARRILIPPDQRGTGLDPEGSSGVFHIVLAGELHTGASELGCLESLFASADERPVQLQAGSRGAEVLSLRIPVKPPPYA